MTPLDSLPERETRTIETVSRELTAAKDRVRELGNELDKLRGAELGVHRGDVVLARFRSNDEPEEVKITRVESRFGWIRGVTRKKNGDWGRQERQYFDNWEKS